MVSMVSMVRILRDIDQELESYGNRLADLLLKQLGALAREEIGTESVITSAEQVFVEFAENIDVFVTSIAVDELATRAQRKLAVAAQITNGLASILRLPIVDSSTQPIDTKDSDDSGRKDHLARAICKCLMDVVPSKAGDSLMPNVGSANSRSESPVQRAARIVWDELQHNHVPDRKIVHGLQGGGDDPAR